MATKNFVNNLKEVVTCPICLSILQGPATLPCGHNFCLECINQNGKEATGKCMKCPVCKKTVKKNSKFRHNWQLMNLVEQIQAMDPPEKPLESEELTCLNHGEKYHYFCEDDGKFACLVCRDSENHKSHTTVLMEEVARSYQEKLELKIKVLKQKEKTIKEAKKQGEQKVNVFMTQTDLEKQRIIKEFKQLYQVLKEEENFLLTRTNWLIQEMEKAKKFHIASCEEQLDCLHKLTHSLMCRLNLPPSLLLKDIKDLLYRSEKFDFLSPTPLSLDLEKKINEVKSRNNELTDDLDKFKDKLQTDGKKEKSKFFKGMNEEYILNFIENLSQKDNSEMNKTSEPKSPSTGKKTTNPLSPDFCPKVPFDFLSVGNCTEKTILSPLPQPRSKASLCVNSLNPAHKEDPCGTAEFMMTELTPMSLDETSAHPDLIISEDLKTATLDYIFHASWEEPTNLQCFFPFRCVLGSRGLCSGRQAWEVELDGPEGGGCVLGVASELVPRRGFLVLKVSAGFWVLRIAGSKCQAITDEGTQEDLPIISPKKVGVYVDFEGGRVRFYDAIRGIHIYTFHTSFPGQIFPFFRLLFPGTRITLRP